MRDLVRLIVWAVVDLFRSRAAIEAEILTLRQQIIVLRRTAPKKRSFGAIDRLVFVGVYRLFPRVLDVLAIVRPATVIKWHRAGFRLYWRWKSRPRGGRPPVPLEIRRLIREMSIANPLWGAPRIHGQLLKLDIAIGQTSVATYMAKRVCRRADRFEPTGMPRPRCRVRRMPPPPPAAVVHDILQWRPHTSLLGEGCAVLAYRRTGRADSLPPNSRRAAPPICPHLIFDRHSYQLMIMCARAATAPNCSGFTIRQICGIMRSPLTHAAFSAP